MEEVRERKNCWQAYKRVKANKGSPGIDGMKVGDLSGYRKPHWPTIREQLLFIASAMLVFTGTLHAQSTTQTPSRATESVRNPWMRLANNGIWWASLSADSKTDFVDGFVTAMADVHKMLTGFVKQNSKELTPGRPTFDAQVSAILQLSVIAERYEYDEVGREKLPSGVDTFYKDPLNKFIPIEFAFGWERDTLNGKVAPRDLQKQLDEWRSMMNKQ